MAFDTIKPVLHTNNIRLYRSNLPDARGRWFARPARETVLDIEKVAVSLKTRGGSTGNYNDMVRYVKQYFDEVAFLLADGFIIDTGYFKIQTMVKGAFKSGHDSFDPARHRIAFQFSPLKPMRELLKLIKISVLRGQRTQAGIISFTDVESQARNKTVTPGGMFIMKGKAIKIAGEKRDSGLWFIAAEGGKRYKVTREAASNTMGTVAGIAPPLPVGEYSLEIKTRYTTGGRLLKEPRTITSKFTLHRQ